MSAFRPIQTGETVWRLYDEAEARLAAPLSERMIALAGLRPGMNVLDLGTGRGEPAILAARRVAPAGSVIGVDLTSALLDMARERAAREGVSNIDLRVANAESLDGIPNARFDATLARWCLMYWRYPSPRSPRPAGRWYHEARSWPRFGPSPSGSRIFRCRDVR